MHSIYKEVISPALDKLDQKETFLDSETCHHLTREILRLAEISPVTLKILELLVDHRGRFKDERLKVVLGGILLENPLIVAAGWTKDGRAVEALGKLGFSGVEVGTVVPKEQPGNPGKRQHIVYPGVVINNIGLSSPGAGVVEKNLERYKDSGIPIIGINVGINRNTPDIMAPEMYAFVVKRFYKNAAYFVINVSCPNQPGLSKFQDKKLLTDIIQAVNGVMDDAGKRKPLFVKISPDLTDKEIGDIIDVVLANGLTGIVAVNTTVNPEIKVKYGKRWRKELGGLSGDDEDFRKLATEKVAHIYKETQGKIEIIGVGGVKDTQTALDKVKAGAKVVQVLTAIRGEGPGVANRINRGLAEWMDKEGVKNIKDIVGSAVKR